MSSDQPVYPYPGILLDPEGEPKYVAIRWALLSADNTDLKVKWAGGKVEHFSVSSITQDSRTDTMEFVSEGVRYTIRRLRETDGRWLSTLMIDLPEDVLETLILQGDQEMPTESLTAYALDDSPYVVGLVYTGPTGMWSRIDGDWAQLSPSDDTFSSYNIYGIDIDPEKAQAFIDLYDKNYVNVADVEQYESADSNAQV